MNPLCLLTAAFAVGAEPEEFYHDFRQGQLHAPIRYTSPKAKARVKPESAGLRITLVPEPKPAPAVGVECPLAIHGDFEVTIGYEIVSASKPESGYGMGLRLQIRAASPKQDGAVIARALHPVEGDVYSTGRWFTQADGKEKHNGRHFPASAKRGQLRFRRTGTELVYLAAEGNSEQFRELRREPFPDDPLTLVRVVADTGTSATGELDARVYDLRIRSAEVSAAPAVTRARTQWTWWIVGGVTGAALIAGAAVWYVFRRRARDDDDE